MIKLSIFDCNILIGTITQVNNGSIYIFGKSSTDWRNLNRLVNYGYKVDKNNKKFLEYVAKQAHEFDYNTELIKL